MHKHPPRTSKLFILGNGPSLRGFDFHKLDHVVTLGMNAAYRHWDRINWYPTYYCCMDTTVIISHASQIYRLIQEREHNKIQAFFLRENILEQYPDLSDQDSVFFLEKEQVHHPILQINLITTGAQSALWGAYLGYSQIFLLGIDSSYTEHIAGIKRVEGIVLELEKTPTENPNYFFDDYQQAGDRFHVPNPNPEYPVHIHSWLEANAKLQAAGVSIANCNLQSNLVIFPFMPVDEALTVPEHPNIHSQPIQPSRLSLLRSYFGGGSGILAAIAILLQALSFLDLPFAWLLSILTIIIVLLMLGNSIMGVYQRVDGSFNKLESHINRNIPLRNEMQLIETRRAKQLNALHNQVRVLEKQIAAMTAASDSDRADGNNRNIEEKL